jgi:hypothetical protein
LDETGLDGNRNLVKASPNYPVYAELPEVGQCLGECNQFVLRWVETNASQQKFPGGRWLDTRDVCQTSSHDVKPLSYAEPRCAEELALVVLILATLPAQRRSPAISFSCRGPMP